MNIQKIVELVEVGADFSGSVNVNIYDYPAREDATKFVDELSSKLQVQFDEGGRNQTKWFATGIGSCEVTVFYKNE